MLKSMAAGAIIGAAVGVLLIPQLDRRTQKALRKTGRRMMGMAEDAYENIVDYVR